MNGIFDQIELKMLDSIMKSGAITKKKHNDRKKYLKDLVKTLYLNQ
tara:strand:+ start:4944 stop:5081 length:138 start_codon:yes stop_codon:yes gene_type:complete